MVRLNATPRGGTDAGWAACFLGHLLGWPVDPVMVVPRGVGSDKPHDTLRTSSFGDHGAPGLLMF